MFGVRVVACCLAVVCAAIASLFNSVQPAPYMDEVFHVPQAANYCHHNFSHWDPMITTLPGLYVSHWVCSFELGIEHHNMYMLGA